MELLSLKKNYVANGDPVKFHIYDLLRTQISDYSN